MENNLNTSNCNQCEAIHINGTLCHETGCPDAWQRVTECKWCGSDFSPEQRGQEFCDESCAHCWAGVPYPQDCTYCDDCGDEIDAGADTCDTCDDDSALNDAARDYIRGTGSRGDAGSILDTLADIGSGLDRSPWGAS